MEYKKHFYNIEKYGQWGNPAVCGHIPEHRGTWDDEKVTCNSCKDHLMKIDYCYAHIIQTLINNETAYRPFCALSKVEQLVLLDTICYPLERPNAVEVLSERGEWKTIGYNNIAPKNGVFRLRPFFYMPLSNEEVIEYAKNDTYVNNKFLRNRHVTVGSTLMSIIGISSDDKIILGNISDGPKEDSIDGYDTDNVIGPNGVVNYPWIVLHSMSLTKMAVTLDGKRIGHKIPSEKYDEAKRMWSTRRDDEMKNLVMEEA
jgi:hypothetical protein